MRYFHPSDEAAAAKWDQFTLDGVAAVEAAKSPQELAASLEKLFKPIAPTVSVYITGQAPPAREPVKEGTKLVAWYHVGVGGQSSVYSSRRVEKAPGNVKLPDPNKTYLADLGGGLSCSVPLSLPRDYVSTLPKATA